MAVGRVNVGNSKSNTYIWQFEGYENIKNEIFTTISQNFSSTRIPIGDYVIGNSGRVWKENGQSLIQTATLADGDVGGVNRRHFKDNKVISQSSSSSYNCITLNIDNLLTGVRVYLVNPLNSDGFTKNVLYFIHEEKLIVLDKINSSYKKLVYRWSDGTLISNEDINSFYYTTYGGGLTYSSLDGYFYVIKNYMFYKINANTMEVVGQVQTPNFYCQDYIFKDGFAYLLIRDGGKTNSGITIINTNTMKLVKTIQLTNIAIYCSIDSNEDYVIVTTGVTDSDGKAYFINSSNTIEQSIDFAHNGVAGKYNFFSKDGVFIYKLKEKNL